MASYNEKSSKAKVAKVKPLLRKFNPSEKKSLDLDRPAQEQSFGRYDLEPSTTSRSVHDVSFTSTRRGYHARSTSGTSQYSNTTTGSGQRHGTFVHPFQQTPRPYTPPSASYQGSQCDLTRDSAALIEDDEHPTHLRSTSTISTRTNSHSTLTSLQSSQQPPLRITTKSSSSSRLVLGTSPSNLQPSLSSDLQSPAETISPVSAVRSSMDMGFRIRSHSHQDSNARFETVQEARKAWQEREDAKAEKIALEEARSAEKRARRLERAGRRSTASDGVRSKRSKSDPTTIQEKDTEFISQDYDNTPRLRAPHTVEGHIPNPKHGKASTSTKRKTQSTFMAFLIWFRTRLLRMKKH